MTRVACLAAAVCAILATACTAGHPARVATGASTPAPAGHTDIVDLWYVTHR